MIDFQTAEQVAIMVSQGETDIAEIKKGLDRKDIPGLDSFIESLILKNKTAEGRTTRRTRNNVPEDMWEKIKNKNAAFGPGDEVLVLAPELARFYGESAVVTQVFPKELKVEFENGVIKNIPKKVVKIMKRAARIDLGTEVFWDLYKGKVVDYIAEDDQYMVEVTKGDDMNPKGSLVYVDPALVKKVSGDDSSMVLIGGTRVYPVARLTRNAAILKPNPDGLIACNKKNFAVVGSQKDDVYKDSAGHPLELFEEVTLVEVPVLTEGVRTPTKGWQVQAFKKSGLIELKHLGWKTPAGEIISSGFVIDAESDNVLSEKLVVPKEPSGCQVLSYKDGILARVDDGIKESGEYKFLETLDKKYKILAEENFPVIGEMLGMRVFKASAEIPLEVEEKIKEWAELDKQITLMKAEMKQVSERYATLQVELLPVVKEMTDMQIKTGDLIVQAKLRMGASNKYKELYLSALTKLNEATKQVVQSLEKDFLTKVPNWSLKRVAGDKKADLKAIWEGVKAFAKKIMGYIRAWSDAINDLEDLVNKKESSGINKGDEVVLIRPLSTYREVFEEGTKGIVKSISESGSLWIEEIGWVEPANVKKAFKKAQAIRIEKSDPDYNRLREYYTNQGSLDWYDDNNGDLVINMEVPLGDVA